MFNRLSRLNFTRESSFKGTLDWALANVFEDLDFLSHNYCEQNKTARSEIYQRHRHVSLPLDQSVVTLLLPQELFLLGLLLAWKSAQRRISLNFPPFQPPRDTSFVIANIFFGTYIPFL